MVRTASGPLKRTLWLIVGLTALALGAIGAILPVVPTTPFVILAAFAFGKSSRRLRILLERNRLFGPAIRDWRANGAIAVRYKAVAVVMMAASIVLSFVLSVPGFALAIQIVCIGAATVFILSRPSTAKA